MVAGESSALFALLAGLVFLLVFAGFAVVVLVVGPRVMSGLFRVADRARSPTLTGFAAVVVAGIGLAGASVGLGLEAVLGAFLAGVLVRDPVDADTERVFQVATLGLFAPLFFATAGLRADLSGLLAPATLGVAAATLVVAIAGKFLGVAAGAAFTTSRGPSRSVSPSASTPAARWRSSSRRWASRWVSSPRPSTPWSSSSPSSPP